MHDRENRLTKVRQLNYLEYGSELDRPLETLILRLSSLSLSLVLIWAFSGLNTPQ